MGNLLEIAYWVAALESMKYNRTSPQIRDYLCTLPVACPFKSHGDSIT